MSRRACTVLTVAIVGIAVIGAVLTVAHSPYWSLIAFIVIFGLLVVVRNSELEER